MNKFLNAVDNLAAKAEAKAAAIAAEAAAIVAEALAKLEVEIEEKIINPVRFGWNLVLKEEILLHFAILLVGLILCVWKGKHSHKVSMFIIGAFPALLLHPFFVKMMETNAAEGSANNNDVINTRPTIVPGVLVAVIGIVFGVVSVLLRKNFGALIVGGICGGVIGVVVCEAILYMLSFAEGGGGVVILIVCPLSIGGGAGVAKFKLENFIKQLMIVTISGISSYALVFLAGQGFGHHYVTEYPTTREQFKASWKVNFHKKGIAYPVHPITKFASHLLNKWTALLGEVRQSLSEDMENQRVKASSHLTNWGRLPSGAEQYVKWLGGQDYVAEQQRRMNQNQACFWSICFTVLCGLGFFVDHFFSADEESESEPTKTTPLPNPTPRRARNADGTLRVHTLNNI